MQYLFMEIFHLKYIKFFVRYFFATISNSDCSFAQFSGSSETKVFLASISVPMQQLVCWFTRKTFLRFCLLFVPLFPHYNHMFSLHLLFNIQTACFIIHSHLFWFYCGIWNWSKLTVEKLRLLWKFNFLRLKMITTLRENHWEAYLALALFVFQKNKRA